MKLYPAHILTVCMSVLCIPAFSQSGDPLPDPLTFNAAIAIADQPVHFEDLQLLAQSERADASVLAAQSDQDLQFELKLLLQYVDPVVNPTGDVEDDHILALVMRKQLYDGGVSSELETAADHKLNAIKYLRDSLRLKRKLEISRKFFDVKLADSKFAYYNEAIATAYIKFDKTKQRNELGLKSDIDLSEAEYAYNKVRASRYKSEVEQRNSRSKLAESLARPDDLPTNVKLPDLTYIKDKRPELDELIKQAMDNNLQLKAQRELVEAAAGEMAAMRNLGGVTLSSEIEIAENSRELIARNNWRAALSLNIPLGDTYKNKAQVKNASANWQNEKAKLLQFESEIRQKVLENWQAIHVLQAELEAAEKGLAYRELYQDRSRGYYEMEYVTDLGDSFVELSGARFDELEVKLNLAMAWLKLNMLTGNWHSEATEK